MPLDAPVKEIEAIDPAAESAAIKTRAVSGVKVLAARTLISVLLRVVSSLVLARLLFPKDYGVFGVVAYIAGLGMFLSDVGLASSLVRREAKPTRDEAFTVFCTQQIITGIVVVAVIVTTPLLIHIYALSPSAKSLLYGMSFGLFLSSLRIVPMMALERDLQFPVIARCELLENLAQTGSTITFAYLGWGAWALAGGGLVRGIVGLSLVWAVSPWQPVGRFEFSIVRRLAPFGFAFQLSAIIPTLMGGWMPLIVGRLLGVGAVGLVGWAANLASVPMMLSGVLSRVAFPSYSRLQADPEAFNKYLSSSIRRVGAIYSLVVPLVVLAFPILILVLFRARWAPAIPLVQWFSLECSLLTLTGLLASAQSALGRAGERLTVTILTGLFRWFGGYLAIVKFGLLGIGPTMFFISLSEMLATGYLLQRRNNGNRILRELVSQVVSTGFLLGTALVASFTIAHNQIVLRTVVSIAILLVLILVRELLMGGRFIFQELRGFIRMFNPVPSGIS